MAARFFIFLRIFCFFAAVFIGSQVAAAFTMGAMGDSITTGYNAMFWRNNRFLSWSTGWDFKTRVYSHYHRLKKKHGAVRAINAAEPGARLHDLHTQLGKFDGEALDYLTIMVGANDVCRWPEQYEAELQLFSENYVALVSRALSEQPRAKVLVAPIPDLFQLYEVGLEKGCSWKWLILPSCTPLTQKSATDESRALFRGRLERTNDVIRQIAATNPERVRYAHGMDSIIYTPEHLDHKDCFHPSLAAQNLFSDATWDDDWLSE